VDIVRDIPELTECEQMFVPRKKRGRHR
jgi:hypothetical protein